MRAMVRCFFFPWLVLWMVQRPSLKWIVVRCLQFGIVVSSLFDHVQTGPKFPCVKRATVLFSVEATTSVTLCGPQWMWIFSLSRLRSTSRVSFVGSVVVIVSPFLLLV